MTKVAIAILNFNGEAYLKQFLPSLIANSNGYTIYIGDNASTDNSVEVLKTEFPTIKCIELKENYGYSKGYNLLIEQIDAEYIALVNSDIEATPEWIEPLIAILDSDSSAAAVQPKIKSWRNKDYFEYAGGAGGYIDKFGYPFCRGRIFDTIEKDIGQYDDQCEISWASGACFLMRKSVFEEAGKFDDEFFAHMEEIDLCWRFHYLGHKIIYTPKTTVYHVGGGTLDYSSPFKTFLNYRNGLYLLQKNLSKESIHRTIFIRVLLDWISVLYNILKGKPRLSGAILRAHAEVFRNRKKTYNKRISDKIDSNQPILENYSIIWSYFIRGKKYFNQLPVNNTRQN